MIHLANGPTVLCFYLRVFEWASTVDWRGLLAKKRGESCPSR